MTFLSVWAQRPQIDPDKFTICAITINSDNERNLFEKEVKKNPTKFNPIVELTTLDEKDWFEKACESGIRCDQLIISGHFGGTFFGSSGKTLSLSDLEKKGCSKSCEGILANPLEVFLFGCNTLATKDMDHRTPEEYLQVLLRDHIPLGQAEFMTEDRYGNVGDDNKSKMQRAFGGDKKILYGFDSVGPSGKNIEGFLKKYLKESNILRRLEKLQAKRMMDSVFEANKVLEEHLKSTSFTQCGAGDDILDDKTKIICGLRDTNKSVDQKIALMNDAFSHEKYLTFIPSINEFLIAHPISEMTEFQKKSALLVSQNPVIKQQVLGLLKNTKGLTLTVEWANLAKNLNFIDDQMASGLITEKVKNVFKKNLSIETKDLLCSFNKQTKDLIKLTAKDIKTQKLIDHDYVAIGCLKPQDQGLQMKLLSGLKHPEYRVRQKVAMAIGDIHPLDQEVQLLLVDGLYDKDPAVRLEVVDALLKIKPTSLNVKLKLAEGLLDSNPFVRSNVTHIFMDIKPQEAEIQLQVVELLSDKDPEIERLLLAINPRDPQILARIKELSPGLWSKMKNRP